MKYLTIVLLVIISIHIYGQEPPKIKLTKNLKKITEPCFFEIVEGKAYKYATKKGECYQLGYANINWNTATEYEITQLWNKIVEEYDVKNAKTIMNDQTKQMAKIWENKDGIVLIFDVKPTKDDLKTFIFNFTIKDKAFMIENGIPIDKECLPN